MRGLESYLIPLSFFAMVILIVYFVGKRNHAERMELIRRGIDPVPYNFRMKFHSGGSGQYSLLLGIILLAVSLAASLSFWTSDAVLKTGGWMFMLSCLFGGAGFIIYWKLTAADRERALKIKEELLLRPGNDFAPEVKPEEKE